MRKPKNITFAVILTLGIVVTYISMLPKNRHQPNLILITLDSLRPDHLGCYGYKRNTSPNIDKLAREGVRFNCAIAQGTATQASVPSFITSTYPYMHLAIVEKHEAYINPDTRTLPGILKENGYTTTLFTDYSDYFGRIHGIEEHFDSKFEFRKDDPGSLTDSALEWLKANKDKKFFAWLYYFGPHSGYESASPYSDDFFKDDFAKDKKYIAIQEDAEDKFDTIPKHVVRNNITDISYYIAKYDGKIRVVDDQLGRLLEGLKNFGLDKNTLVVLLSDHGEGLGEHNYYFRHGGTFYDELLKVPLVMRYPGAIPKNKIIVSQVQLLDLVPTITDFLEITPDSKKQYVKPAGISLKDCIQTKQCAGDREIFSYNPTLAALRTQEYKMIRIDLEKIRTIPVLQNLLGYYKNEYELYGLKKDPFEKDNLENKEKQVFLELRQKLDIFVSNAKIGAVRAKMRIRDYYKLTDTLGPIDKATEEKLKSLGYVQ